MKHGLTEEIIDKYNIKKKPTDWYDRSGYNYELPCGYNMFFMTYECIVGFGCRDVDVSYLESYTNSFCIFNEKQLQHFIKMNREELDKIISLKYNQQIEFLNNIK